MYEMRLITAEVLVYLQWNIQTKTSDSIPNTQANTTTKRAHECQQQQQQQFSQAYGAMVSQQQCMRFQGLILYACRLQGMSLVKGTALMGQRWCPVQLWGRCLLQQWGRWLVQQWCSSRGIR